MPNPDRPPTCSTGVKALIHYLHNMVYTGRRYRGTQSQFAAELAAHIERYKHPPVIIIPPRRRAFTPEENEAILRSKNLRETAKALGRAEGTICRRRQALRRQRTI